MTRLIIVVEGQTEEAFVKDVLRSHLAAFGVFASATIVGKTVAQRRRHRQRGGGRFQHWRRDIERILGGDSTPDLRVTTLFDFYGLPDDFPGFEQHQSEASTLKRCGLLELALADEFNDHRFIPYLQRHEFEALVLGALPVLEQLLENPADLEGLNKLQKEIDNASLEEINDGSGTAPSKRLMSAIPGYNKVVHGPLALSNNNLDRIRQRCPRLNAWLIQLAQLNLEEVEE